MLTEIQEGGKRKSDQYWPDRDNMYLALDNGLTLEHVTTSYQGTFLNRTIRINRQDDCCITVNHLQTKKWADLTAPDSTKILMDLVQKTMELQENDKNSTVLIHCSAGVGRTGTFIAVYKLVEDYLDNK